VDFFSPRAQQIDQAKLSSSRREMGQKPQPKLFTTKDLEQQSHPRRAFFTTKSTKKYRKNVEGWVEWSPAQNLVNTKAYVPGGT
jgi:hypothetical protein